MQPHREPSLAPGSQSGFAECDTLQAGGIAQVEPDTGAKGKANYSKANKALIMASANEDKIIWGRDIPFLK